MKVTLDGGYLFGLVGNGNRWHILRLYEWGFSTRTICGLGPVCHVAALATEESCCKLCLRRYRESRAAAKARGES